MNQSKTHNKTQSKTRKTKILTAIEDFVIREVRINYQPTKETPFAIRAPGDVARFVRGAMSDNSREHAIALYLDGAHQVTAYATISIGGANLTYVHPREVFQRAVAVGAVALVMAHNHPSGQLQPSAEDRALTLRLGDAGRVLGIALLDHVIVTDSGHYSLKEGGDFSPLV